MAEKITKAEGEVLATRNPVPELQRDIQTLVVEAGAPKTPELITPDKTDDLERQVAALKAEKEGLVRGNKAKDKALEDAKKSMEERIVATPDPSDITSLIRSEVAKGIDAGLERERERNAPTLAKVAQIEQKEQRLEAVGEHGEAAVEKFGFAIFRGS